LQPHPEGGFYAEVHRSALRVQPGDGRDKRSALTSIYFLLVDRGISRWHRVSSDEVWIHLEGATVRLHLLDEADRRSDEVQLGPLSASGTRPQHTVPASCWQAAQVDGDFALVACVVGPGFDFADFQLMDPGSPLAAWLRETQPLLASFI
jgi:predicted cupin superfamily sugar epimerase